MPTSTPARFPFAGFMLKEAAIKYTRKPVGILVMALLTCSCALAQDPAWPRKHVQSGGTLLNCQSQVDDWKDFTPLSWREVFHNSGNMSSENLNSEMQDRQRGEASSQSWQHGGSSGGWGGGGGGGLSTTLNVIDAATEPRGGQQPAIVVESRTDERVLFPKAGR